MKSFNKEKIPNICWLQRLRCEDLLFIIVSLYIFLYITYISYLCQRVGVQRSGSMGVAESMLTAAGAPDGRVFRPPQRIMAAHRHGHGGGRAAAALRAVERRGQTLTPSQQQLPGTEVTRHRWRASLHHPPVPVAVAVVRAAEGAAE